MADGGRKSADEALALALAGGATVARAAIAADVSERTVYRRLADPDFAALVTEVQARMVGRAIGRLSATGSLAVGTLRTLARSASSEAVRLGSARALLEYLLKGNEQHVLAQQVEDLRRQMEEIRNDTPKPFPRPRKTQGLC